MPKSLQELANAKRNVKKVGGKKIDFKVVVQKIIESGQYWTVSEVHQQLVQKKVGRFRTMKLLNAACTTKKLERLYDNGKFYYGPRIEK
jgi:peptide methionine sulfoxide reductase MsrA